MQLFLQHFPFHSEGQVSQQRHFRVERSGLEVRCTQTVFSWPRAVRAYLASRIRSFEKRAKTTEGKVTSTHQRSQPQPASLNPHAGRETVPTGRCWPLLQAWEASHCQPCVLRPSRTSSLTSTPNDIQPKERVHMCFLTFSWPWLRTKKGSVTLPYLETVGKLEQQTLSSPSIYSSWCGARRLTNIFI